MSLIRRPLTAFLGIQLTVAVVALAAIAGPAAADVTGVDETPARAFGPAQLNQPYAGTFAGPSDADYVSFSVTSAGQALSFTVRNTTANCADPNDAGCPVYATLVDGNSAQLGGDTSAAGTIATAGDTETFTWSFPQPGTYYILLESNGDLAPGSPAYDVAVGPISPTAGFGGTSGGSGGTGGGSSGGRGTSTGGGPPAPLLRSLFVAPRQRGRAVIGRLVLGQRLARVTATLALSSRGQAIRTQTLVEPRVGAHRLVLRLPDRYVVRLRRGHRLSMFVRIALVTDAGTRQYYTRHLILSR